VLCPSWVVADTIDASSACVAVVWVLVLLVCMHVRVVGML
jgi:hypothetical protein